MTQELFQEAPRASFGNWGKEKDRLDTIMGDTVAPWTLHDLRRTYATTLASLGIPIQVTERLINHVSGSQSGLVAVYQRYNYAAEMREAVALYERHLASLLATMNHAPPEPRPDI
jgi:integrase